MQVGVEASRAVEGKRIFVIDDDEITRAVLQFMLQDDNEAHDLATLGDAFAKAELLAPDLLLLGVAHLERNEATLSGLISRWPGVRILVIAGEGGEAGAQHWLRRGAHGVLAKPFTLSSVRRRVDAQLGHRVPGLVQMQILSGAVR